MYLSAQRTVKAHRPKRGEWQLEGNLRHFQDTNSHAPVTFAWSGDLGGQQRCRVGPDGYPIFDVSRQHLDFFLFLGDTIYSDDVCPAPPNEPGADFKATTLDQYRARHRYQRGSLPLRRFLASVPVYVTWDDHEVKNNFAGPYEERMPAGRQALREYWPIASPPMIRSGCIGRFATARTSKCSSSIAAISESKRRSGRASEDDVRRGAVAVVVAWGLRNSLATWKVIATSVPLSIPKGGGAGGPR